MQRRNSGGTTKISRNFTNWMNINQLPECSERFFYIKSSKHETVEIERRSISRYVKWYKPVNDQNSRLKVELLEQLELDGAKCESKNRKVKGKIRKSVKENDFNFRLQLFVNHSGVENIIPSQLFIKNS